MKEDIPTRRARALARLERAKAAMAAINARERASDRKRDTRRKILIGAALLARASADARIADLVTELVAGLDRPVDRMAFEGWTVTKPVPATAPKSQGASAATFRVELRRGALVASPKQPAPNAAPPTASLPQTKGA